ncbi:MAG TPA: glycosyltransferase [Saprospiraceae bacterium]|nr:glycosyltransferase [Saprospiraceae bacterium]
MKIKSVVCFGPGPVFKGGLSNYNTSLAQTLHEHRQVKVHIISWTEQYPSIIPRKFKDTVSKNHFLDDTQIEISYLTNFNNPFSWSKTAHAIQKIDPDIVIIQWSIALQGLPLGFIARKIKAICKAKIVFDLHFVFQKEQSMLDRFLTKFALRHGHAFIVHAFKTFRELHDIFPSLPFELILPENRHSVKTNSIPVLKLFHPVYKLYYPDPSFDTNSFKKELGLQGFVFLFFGFIRKYKGLHHTIEAFAGVLKERKDASLLIVGEAFWDTLNERLWVARIKKFLFRVAGKVLLKESDDETEYRPLELIHQYGIDDYVSQKIAFIPNEDVHKYFQVSDAIVLYYTTATPSGVESLAYNFQLPILATRVGHFPETVKEGYSGYLAEAGDIESMKNAMIKMMETPIDRSNIISTADSMSWEKYVDAILKHF